MQESTEGIHFSCQGPAINDSVPIVDIEDMRRPSPVSGMKKIVVTKKKRKRDELQAPEFNSDAISWREALGAPPSCDNFKVLHQYLVYETGGNYCLDKILFIWYSQEWLEYQKKKWAWQMQNRAFRVANEISNGFSNGDSEDTSVKRSRLSGKATTSDRGTLSGFFRRAQRSLLDLPWEILQVIFIPILFFCFCYCQCVKELISY